MRTASPISIAQSPRLRKPFCYKQRFILVFPPLIWGEARWGQLVALLPPLAPHYTRGRNITEKNFRYSLARLRLLLASFLFFQLHTQKSLLGQSLLRYRRRALQELRVMGSATYLLLFGFDFAAPDLPPPLLQAELLCILSLLLLARAFLRENLQLQLENSPRYQLFDFQSSLLPIPVLDTTQQFLNRNS